MRSTIIGSRLVAIASVLPIRSLPAAGSARNSSSVMLVCRSSSMAAPRASRARPKTVGATPRGLRSSRRRPNRRSRSATAFDTKGWEVARRSAAFAMLPCSATSISTLRCRNLRRRLISAARSMKSPCKSRQSCGGRADYSKTDRCNFRCAQRSRALRAGRRFLRLRGGRRRLAPGDPERLDEKLAERDEVDLARRGAAPAEADNAAGLGCCEAQELHPLVAHLDVDRDLRHEGHAIA